MTLISFDRNLLPGVVAVGLFGIMAAVFLGADFGEFAGFPDVSIVAGIGYALIGAPQESGVAVGSFLAALILVAVLLDAALDGALMLGKRDEGGER